MIALNKLVAYCDERTRRRDIRDYPRALNGLQVENATGMVRRIAVSVDAGMIPFQRATDLGANLILVHHGLFWDPPTPLKGRHYQKVKWLMDHDLALYSSHLPLDAHPEIGNNACIAKALDLDVLDWAFPYEGTPIGAIAELRESRESLVKKLKALFPRLLAMEFGSEEPRRIAISSGAGNSLLPQLKSHGIDTLLTGELSQHNYNLAQELSLNVYAGGHYDTEVFGIKALAEELSEHFDLPWDFIPSDCPI